MWLPRCAGYVGDSDQTWDGDTKEAEAEEGIDMATVILLQKNKILPDAMENYQWNSRWER